MKKIDLKSMLSKLSAFALMLAAVSCGEKTPGTEPPVEDKISFNPTSLILDAADVSGTFKLTTSGAWSIETTEDWITGIQPDSGDAAVTDQQITLTVTPYDGDMNTGKITVTCGELQKDYTITQVGSGPSTVLGQATLMKATLIEDAMGFNMLSDPGFEDYPEEALNYKCPWWIEFSVRSTEAHTGNYSAEQNFTNPENLGFQTFAGAPNTDYEVSAWFKSNHATENPDVFLGIRKSIEGRPVLKDETKAAGITDSWSKQTVSFNSGDLSTLEAFAFVFTKEDYKYWWDDVCVKRPGDTQKSYKLSNITEIGSVLSDLDGITSADGCTLWDGGSGKVMMAFGGNAGIGDADPRANALAVSTDASLADGMSATVVKDGDKPKVIIPAAGGTEKACVPTAGVNVGSRQYLHYMSVNDKAFAEDMWTVNNSSIAYSDDDGETWTKSDLEWGADSNFAEVTFLKDGGYVYMYGSSAGRANANEQWVKVARAAEADLLTQSAWKYWNGTEWAADESAATPIIYAGTLGELSVIKNQNGRYMMLYSSIKRNAVVVRDAGSPVGDWSGEKLVVVDTDEARLFAPVFHPVSASGNDIYFIVSSAFGE